MQLARVCGQVISTKKAEKLMGFKILVCQPIDMVTFKEKGAPFVSIDRRRSGRRRARNVRLRFFVQADVGYGRKAGG